MPRCNQIPIRVPALFLLMGMVLDLILAREFTAPIGFVLCLAALIAGLSYGLSKRSGRLWLLSFKTAYLTLLFANILRDPKGRQ